MRVINIWRWVFIAAGVFYSTLLVVAAFSH